MVYNNSMSDEYSHRILRVRLYELGHEFKDIDALNLQDLGDITGYWDGKAKGEAKLRKINRPASRGRGKR